MDVKSIALFVLGMVGTVTGGWIKDRLSMENRETTSAVSVVELERRVSALSTDVVPRREYERMTEELKTSAKNAVTKEEFEQFERRMDQRLTDEAQDIRDIKRAVVRGDRGR